MCRRVTCPNCKKPDWRGCGAHVEQVLSDVSSEHRCSCKPEDKAGPGFLSWLWKR